MYEYRMLNFQNMTDKSKIFVTVSEHQIGFAKTYDCQTRNM